MAKRQARPKLELIQGISWAEQLPKQDAQLAREMVDQWRMHCIGRNYENKSVNRDQAAIVDFIRVSGHAPWMWTEEDFDRWNVHLIRDPKRSLRPSTLRTYQGAVRRFLGYLVDNVYYQTEVRRRYNVSIRQICHEGNCVPHLVENDALHPHRAFTHGEFAKFFDALDQAITDAFQFTAKGLRPLQRDKALYYLLYIGAVRISEALGTNTNSFLENVEFPQFGKYGRVEVWGKGSKGSGPRRGMVVIDHPKLPKILDWYEKNVRPHMLNKKNPNETAMFLSERGTRLDITTVDTRFKQIVKLAGLDDTELTPHSMRRTSATHGGMEMNSTIPQQKKLRHASLGTTEGYADYPDPWIRSKHSKAIRHRIEKAKEKAEKQPKNGNEGDPNGK